MPKKRVMSFLSFVPFMQSEPSLQSVPFVQSKVVPWKKLLISLETSRALHRAAFRHREVQLFEIITPRRHCKITALAALRATGFVR